jgi:hypothetical protein
MQTDERKELETNTLATSLDGVVEKLKGSAKLLIVLGVVLVLVVAAAIYIPSVNQQKLSQSWEAFSRARTQQELEKVETRHSGTVVSVFARVAKADRLYEEGLQNLRDPETAKENFETAKRIYDDVKSKNITPLLTLRTEFSSALCAESLYWVSTSGEKSNPDLKAQAIKGFEATVHLGKRIGASPHPLALEAESRKQSLTSSSDTLALLKRPTGMGTVPTLPGDPHFPVIPGGLFPPEPKP